MGWSTALKVPGRLLQPQDLKEIVEYLNKRKPSSETYDVVNIGWTTGIARERDSEKVRQFAESGMTWWLESLYTKRDSLEGMRSRIKNGPPKIIRA